MKKSTRILALIFSFVMLLSCFASCGGKAEALMTLEDRELSINVYRLMLSIRKGEMAFAVAQSYGSANSENFWGTVIDGSGKTYDDHYTEEVLDKAKSYLAALTLFDELGLTLPTAYEKQIDEEMAALVEEDGGGSKTALNAILADFGANYDILREYKLMVKKIEWLMLSLYGENAAKVSTALKDQYLGDLYVAFKQILLSDFRYLFETDKNGDEIYYTTEGAIAYDKTNGTPVPEGDLFVYYTEDGRVAYDKVNGKRKPITDEKGNQLTENYSQDEMLDRLSLALTLRDTCEGAPAATFEELRLTYSDEEFGSDYDSEALSYLGTNIPYASVSSSWKPMETLAAKLADMEVGSIAVVQTEAGIHILRKYPTEARAYADERYSQWFTDALYHVYDFNTNLTSELMTERLIEKLAAIEIRTELLDGVSLKTSPSNFYYN